MTKRLSYREALAEVERLNAILEGMRTSEQQLMAALAKLEAHIDEQGTYNHRLVRRLADAMEIVRDVAAIEQRQYRYDKSTPYNLMISMLTISRARALLESEAAHDG